MNASRPVADDGNGSRANIAVMNAHDLSQPVNPDLARFEALRTAPRPNRRAEGATDWLDLSDEPLAVAGRLIRDPSASVGELAESMGAGLVGLRSLIDEIIASISKPRFQARLRSLGWFRMAHVRQGRRWPGVIGSPPAVAQPEGEAAPVAQWVDGPLASALGTVSFSTNRSAQALLSSPLIDLLTWGSAIADHAADALEETVVDSLAAASFAGGQVQAAALSHTSLAAALAQVEVLTLPGGGRVPRPGWLVASPDAVASAAATWEASFLAMLGLRLAVSRYVAAGDWFVLPATGKTSVNLNSVIGLDARNLGANTDSTSNYVIAAHLLVAEQADLLLAADGSPLGCIKGGV